MITIEDSNYGEQRLLTKMDSLIKASICAQLYMLAAVNVQKKVVLWTSIVVVLFTLFTTFVSAIACRTMS